MSNINDRVLSELTNILRSFPSVLVSIIEEYTRPPSLIVITGEKRERGDYFVGQWVFQFLKQKKHSFLYQELPYEFVRLLSSDRKILRYEIAPLFGEAFIGQSPHCHVVFDESGQHVQLKESPFEKPRMNEWIALIEYHWKESYEMTEYRGSQFVEK